MPNENLLNPISKSVQTIGHTMLAIQKASEYKGDTPNIVHEYSTVYFITRPLKELGAVYWKAYLASGWTHTHTQYGMLPMHSRHYMPSYWLGPPQSPHATDCLCSTSLLHWKHKIMMHHMMSMLGTSQAYV